MLRYIFLMFVTFPLTVLSCVGGIYCGQLTGRCIAASLAPFGIVLKTDKDLKREKQEKERQEKEKKEKELERLSKIAAKAAADASAAVKKSSAAKKTSTRPSGTTTRPAAKPSVKQSSSQPNGNKRNTYLNYKH